MTNQNPEHARNRWEEMHALPLEELRRRVQFPVYADNDHRMAERILADRDAAVASELQERAIERQEEANALVRRANELDEDANASAREANDLARAANDIAADAAASAREAADSAKDTADSARRSVVAADKANRDAHRSMLIAAAMTIISIISIGYTVWHDHEAQAQAAPAPRRP